MPTHERIPAPVDLPAPVPLPSLPTAFSRRAALFGAVASTGFLAAAGASALAQGEIVTTLPSPLDPAAEPDPIFDAIERHRAAEAAFVEMVSTSDDFDDRHRVASDAEIVARHDMHQAVPTTMAGLAAYVAHWSAFTNPPEFRLRLTQLDEIGWEAVPTIAEAMANLLRSWLTLASSRAISRPFRALLRRFPGAGPSSGLLPSLRLQWPPYRP